MIRSYKDLYLRLSDLPKAKLAVANPKGRDILDALDNAEKRGWIEPILVNDDSPKLAAARSVELIRKGEADLLMKGDLDTSIILKAVVDSKTGLRTKNRLSHIAVVDSPEYDRLMLFTDGGVNIEIDEKIARSMVENSIGFAKSLGIAKPKVSVMGLVEKVTSSLPETGFASMIASEFKNDSRLIIEGPVPLDIALSERAAKIKNYNSKVAGQTDIFIGPSITTTNFTVKALLALGNAKGGGIVLGASVPVILLSRADSAETKLNSIALGLIARKGAL